MGEEFELGGVYGGGGRLGYVWGVHEGGWVYVGGGKGVVVVGGGGGFEEGLGVQLGGGGELGGVYGGGWLGYVWGLRVVRSGTWGGGRDFFAIFFSQKIRNRCVQDKLE